MRLLFPALVALAAAGCAAAGNDADAEAAANALTDVQLADPTVEPPIATKDRGTGVVWATLEGPLFAEGGPRFDNPAQHNVSDCLVLSTLAGIALQKPERIRELITSNADGSFTVHFTPADVVVDRKMPWRDGALLYANRRTSNAIWPEIVEKAFAKLHGGYDVFGDGSIPDRIHELVGYETHVERTDAFDAPQALFERVDGALKAGRVAVLATGSKGTIGTIGGVDRLVGGHKYTALATRRDGDTLFIQLRNPWGHYEPEGDGADDGVFWLRAHDVKGAFSFVVVVDVN
jgi:hypothetical protein